MKFSLVLALILTGVINSHAQSVSLIPMPSEMQITNGKFTVSSTTSVDIKAFPGSTVVLNYFLEKIKTSTGLKISTSAESKADVIVFVLNKKADEKIGDEGYTLIATASQVTLTANTSAGLFYAVQTLLQLLPKEIESDKVVQNVKWEIPTVTITDNPRFAWRGVMLDVSRHFFSKEYVKEYIDQIARYKFNRLHFHLTDDNGWRIEIKSLPRLTEIGAWRVPRYGTYGKHELPKPNEQATDGGFYTHEDIREIVAYGKARFVEIMPEIDVPGHSMAAIASYPELCVTKDPNIKVNPGTEFSKWFGNGKFEMLIDNTLNPTDEKVYTFLDKVFTEVAMLFPFDYIHMGGDECYKGYWEKDAMVQSFMKKNNLKDAVQLQNYFTNRVHKIITTKNKKLMGWDEILEGGSLPTDAVVMSWRGIKGAVEATHKKHFVVMSPNPQYYLDMMQGESSIEARVYDQSRLIDTYNFDIVPPEVDANYLLGGQGNLWTEQITTTPQVEYMTYPRAFALSETFWSPASKKDWRNFMSRVEDHFERFDVAGINYARSIYDPILTVKKDKSGKLTIELATEALNLDIYYTLDNTIPNQYYSKYEKPITLPEGTDMIRLISYRDGKPMGRLISLTTEQLLKRAK